MPLIAVRRAVPAMIMFFVTQMYLRNHSVQMKYVYPLVILFFLLSVAEAVDEVVKSVSFALVVEK